MIEQWENADSPRFEMLALDSKVNCERFAQPLKQPLESVSTDEGIQSDRSDTQLAIGLIDEGR
jgi:hypothetical protein